MKHLSILLSALVLTACPWNEECGNYLLWCKPGGGYYRFLRYEFWMTQKEVDYTNQGKDKSGLGSVEKIKKIKILRSCGVDPYGLPHSPAEKVIPVTKEQNDCIYKQGLCQLSGEYKCNNLEE